MVEESSKNVEKQMSKFMNDHFKAYIQPMMKASHDCSAICCSDKYASIEKVHDCVSNCQNNTSLMQDLVLSHLNSIQANLHGCIQDQLKLIREKVPDNNDKEILKHRSEFDRKVVECSERALKMLPEASEKIKAGAKLFNKP